jgi:hypothetical protein
MRRLLAIAPLILGVFVGAVGAAAPSSRLHDQGFGPVHVGMTVRQAARALGAPLVAADDSSPADGCWHVKPARGHDGVVFMVQDGRIARASVWGGSGAIRTLRDVGVGDDAAKVRRLYGPRLSETAHAYGGEGARYLTYWTRGGTRGVRFETDDVGKVDAIHAGGPAIRLIEGCS